MVIKLNKAFKTARGTKKRYRILYGGAGSGKSHYMAQETILNMLYNKEYSYLIVRKTNKSIRNSVFKLLCDIISEYDLASKFHINKTEMSIKCLNGSTVITSGLDKQTLSSINFSNSVKLLT
jgi:phage terminase large subunit